MKIAILADTHFGIRNDKQVFMNATEDFLRDTFFPYLKTNGIDTLIHLGDIFDKRKNLDVKTVETAKKCFFGVLRDRGIDTHILLGHHDIYYRNTNDINSTEMLFRDTDFKIYKSPEIVEFDGTEIFMCPWINDENLDDVLSKISKTKSQILMGHLELVGFNMDKFNVAKHGMDKKIFEKFDVVCSGHYHHKSTTGNINYLGSHMQFTWSDWGDERGFHVFDTDTRELTFIPNPVIMYHKLTDVEDELPDNLHENGFLRVMLNKKIDDATYSELIDTLSQKSLSDAKFIENYDTSLITEDDEYTIDESEDTPVIISKYIDSLKTEIDKKHLKAVLSDLYKNAMDTT